LEEVLEVETRKKVRVVSGCSRKSEDRGPGLEDVEGGLEVETRKGSEKVVSSCSRKSEDRGPGLEDVEGGLEVETRKKVRKWSADA
jgi:hypothetical protein